MSQDGKQEQLKHERDQDDQLSEELSPKRPKVDYDDNSEDNEDQKLEKVEYQNGDQYSEKDEKEDVDEQAKGETGQEEEPQIEEKQIQKPSSEAEQRKIQRIINDFGVNPLDWPTHGTEVFMGGIPREASETQIIQFCEQMGEVFQFNFSKDEKSSINKGFGYCTYRTKNQALAAVRELHDTEISDFPGKKIRISLSEESKYKLYISNISKALNKEALQGILELDLVGIEAIDLLKDKQEENRNRGFCFVEFYNSKCAEYAKRKLSDKQYRLEGQEIFVTWAEPKKSFDQQQTDKSKEVYVGNLPDDVDEKGLQQLFENKYGPIVRVVIPKFPQESSDQKKQFDYGFIHFQNSKDAKKALHEAENSIKIEFDGKVLTIRSTLKNYQQARGGYQQGGRGRGRGYQEEQQYGGRSYGGRGYGRGTGGGGGYQEEEYTDDGYGSYPYQASAGFAYIPMPSYQMPYSYGYARPRPRGYGGDPRFHGRGRGMGRMPRPDMDDGRYGRYGQY